MYPFATAYFHNLSTLLRVHPSLWIVCEGLLLPAGAPLEDSASMQVVRSGAPTNDFTGLHLFNRYRFSSSALAPVCKSRRLYPGCSSLFWQPITKVNLNRNNHVHRFFLHRYQLSRPHSRFSIRSAPTDAPVVSFTTLLLRTTQHTTGLMVKVARFSHREADSHRNSSFAGHTHGVWQ